MFLGHVNVHLCHPAFCRVLSTCLWSRSKKPRNEDPEAFSAWGSNSVTLAGEKRLRLLCYYSGLWWLVIWLWLWNLHGVRVPRNPSSLFLPFDELLPPSWPWAKSEWSNLKKITCVCYTHGVESEQKHSQNSENLVKNFIQGVLFHMSFQSRRLPCL